MNVCPDCFSVDGLKRRIVEIRKNFESGKCNFHNSKKGVPISAVSEIIDHVFRNTYANYTPDGRYDLFHSDQNLKDTIYTLTGAEQDKVATSISDWLEENDRSWSPDGGEPFYSREYNYRYLEDFELDDPHSRRWQYVCHQITHKQRFFNYHAERILSEIFSDLYLLINKSNSSPLYEISKDHKIFRARIANDASSQDRIFADPCSELGPPPEHLRSAGRMNPSGIATFYGAFDIPTCVAELRPAVGETIVAAEFTPRYPLLVLDTTLFLIPPRLSDKFNKEYLRKRSMWVFMQNFMFEISKPHLQNRTHLDYIPTQAVSEYLTQRMKIRFEGSERKIDGVIYQSSQNKVGKNIALFGQAARVHSDIKIEDPLVVSGHIQGFGLKVSKKNLIRQNVTSVSYQTFSYPRDEDIPF